MKNYRATRDTFYALRFYGKGTVTAFAEKPDSSHFVEAPGAEATEATPEPNPGGTIVEAHEIARMAKKPKRAKGVKGK